MTLHRAYCAQWGITEEELNTTPEAPATTAYGAFILDTGLRGKSIRAVHPSQPSSYDFRTGDTSRLVMALAACLLGYGEVGLWLKKEAARPGSWVKLEGNPYKKWIDDYSGPHYQNAVKLGLGGATPVQLLVSRGADNNADTIEELAVFDPPSPGRFLEWQDTWERCVRLEKGFWDMSIGLL